MEKLNKMNLPTKIINDEERFYETTFLLGRDLQFQDLDVDEFFKMYHKDMTREKFVKEKFEEISMYFADSKKRMSKMMNSSYLRHFSKEFKRKYGYDRIGQNKVKKVICLFITDIICDLCYQCYDNLFKEDCVAIFEESVSSEHLGKEFEDVLVAVFRPSLDKELYDLEEKHLAKMHFYRKLHAKYIMAMEDHNKLAEIKDQIHQLLSMNDQELIQLFRKTKSEMDKKTEEFLHYFCNTDYSVTKKKEKPLSQKIKPSSLSEINEITLDIMKNDIAKIKSIYQSYFMYDQDEFEKYCQAISMVYCILTIDKECEAQQMMSYISICLTNIHDMNIKELVFQDKDGRLEKSEKFFKVTNFTYLLAFCLYNQGDQEHQTKRIEGFKAIMKEVIECQETFENVRDEKAKEVGYLHRLYNVFEFSPEQVYIIQMIISVLVNLHIPAVSRRVKKLILSDYEDCSLQAMSKRLTHVYETTELNIFYMHYLSEFADLFVLSFLKDKKCIAIYSPFMRCFDELYKKYEELNQLDVVFSEYFKVKEEKLSYDVEYIEHHYEKEFEQLLDAYHKQKDHLELKKFNELEAIANTLGRSFHYYGGMLDVEMTIRKYQNQIMKYFSNQRDYTNIDEVIYFCCIVRLFESIEEYNEYMPVGKQIKQKEYIDSLKHSLEDQELIIKEQKQDIEKISRSYQSAIMKQIDTKRLEKEIKSYKKEISSLNKQIKEKDKELDVLKCNQDELYKLRNLIYSMQQDDMKVKDQSIDLTPLIKDQKIVIIGGHIHTLDKLKQKYPTLKVANQKSNMIEGLVMNADYVFIYYKYLTHTLYNQAISVLTKNHIPWDYIPYTNIEKSEQVIYEVLKNKMSSF